MSTGVSDQRMRGQGSQAANGPNKEQLNDHEDFSSWRNQSIQNSYPAVAASDPYLSSYYGPSFSYQLDHGAWSSNSAAGSGDMPFLGYGAPAQHQAQHIHQDSYGIDGMFGPSGSFSNFGGQPAFGSGYGVGSDYSSWERKAAHYDDYYQTGRAADHHAGYPPSSTARLEEAPPSSSSGVKQVEQGMQGLALESAKPAAQQEVHQQQQQQPPPQQPKKLTWASIASQPAKPQSTTKRRSMVPPPMVTPRTPSLDIGTWENKNGGGAPNTAPMQPTSPAIQSPPAVQQQQQQPTLAPTKPAVNAHSPSQQQHHHIQHPQQQQHNAQQHQHQQQPSSQQQYQPPVQQQHRQQHEQQHQQQNHHQQQQQRTTRPTPPPVSNQTAHHQPAVVTPPKAAAPPPAPAAPAPPASSSAQALPVLEELQSKHIYNPKEFDLSAKNARFFVIKSYSEDDIHRSIKYEIWCSTEHGNKRLDAAFRERDGKGPVYLYFSVNGSGHFCGMAEMTSAVDMSSTVSVWSQDKWRGQFTVKWIYVKDVPNAALRHIRLENNENKPVTNSRDTQEVPVEKGRQVLKILHSYRHATSIFDDFSHYEKRQAEEDQRKTTAPVSPGGGHDYENDRAPPPPPHQRERDRDGYHRNPQSDRRDRDGFDRDRGDHGMDRGDHRGDRGDRGDHRMDRGDRGDRGDHRMDRMDRGDRGMDRDFRGRNDRNDRPDRSGYEYRERDGYNMRDRDNRGNIRDGPIGFRSSDRDRDRDRDSQPYNNRGDRMGVSGRGGGNMRDNMSRARH